MSEKKNLSVSAEQKDAMIDFMEHHLPLARNQFSSVENGRQLQKDQWEELSMILNSLGGSNKAPLQWKKSWEDLRIRVRAKSNALKVSMLQSGVNGTRPLRNLDDCDQRIINIMSVEAVEGDQTNPEVGVTEPYACFSAPVAPAKKTIDQENRSPEQPKKKRRSAAAEPTESSSEFAAQMMKREAEKVECLKGIHSTLKVIAEYLRPANHTASSAASVAPPATSAASVAPPATSAAADSDAENVVYSDDEIFVNSDDDDIAAEYLDIY